MTTVREILDLGNCPLILADQVLRGSVDAGLAHFILAAAHPDIGQRIDRLVTARLIIPSPKVFLFARTLLAAVGTKEWMMSSEGADDCDLTH